MALKLEIPVGSVFEKRLAELVWDNCPELARQTAAGRMALAIDVADKATVKEATSKVVDSAVSQLVGPLLKAAREQLEVDFSVDAVKVGVEGKIKNAMAAVETTMQKRANEALQEGLQKYWDTVLLNEIKQVSRELFGERELTKIIRERLELLIAEYLKHHLEPHKHGDGRGALVAAKDEMITRVADAVGRKNSVGIDPPQHAG